MIPAGQLWLEAGRAVDATDDDEWLRVRQAVATAYYHICSIHPWSILHTIKEYTSSAAEVLLPADSLGVISIVVSKNRRYEAPTKN